MMIYLGAACLLFVLIHESEAKAPMRVVRCDESKMVDIHVRPNFGTILNFPIKPDNVVLGGQRQFAIEYIRDDLALTALNSNANTNLFVYLQGRRCGFHLIASMRAPDQLVQVRDPEESQMKVPFK